MKRSCPACGGYNNSLVFENQFVIPTQNAFYDGYTVVECDCGMVYADNLPGQSEFDAYYQAQSKKSSRFAVNGYKEPEWYVQIHRSTANWLNKYVGLSGKKVLDAGCFSGDLMKQMTEYGAQCSGYDPSTTGIMMSENLGLDVTKAESFCSSGFFGNKYDLVVLSHVVEHILDHNAFFADIDNAILDNSTIYIEVPDLENFYLSKDPSMMVDQREPMLQFNAEHINFFTKQTLWKMMDRLGYAAIEIEQVTSGIAVLAGLFKRKTLGREYCIRYLSECKIMYEKMDKVLSELGNEPVYIWGAGGHTQRCLSHSIMSLINIEAFIDNDDSLKGATLSGKPIITPLDISKGYPIVISSLLYMDEIAIQIREMDLKNRVIRLYESES